MTSLPDAFVCDGPATISFSGGRTSAYMLWRVLEAHGGCLPANAVVVFANTGKEREETLRFVHECATQWEIEIHWVEWTKGRPGFKEVSFDTASRAGEPFEALIASKSYLPNWQARFCTTHLKIEPMTAFAASRSFAAGHYVELIGLRHDEPWRVAKMKGRNIDDERRCRAPLHEAKITKADVMAFWAGQLFDLALQPWEGNCDLCFLKGRAIRKRIIRDDPDRAAWWAHMEAQTGGWWSSRDQVAALVEEVRRTPELWDAEPPDEHDAECGLYCGEAME